MNWANPEYFWLLTLLPFLIGIQVWRFWKRQRPGLIFSAVSDLGSLPGNYRKWGIWLGPLLFWISYILIVTAIARPQIQNSTVEQHIEGIDIVLSIDISSSMLAEDFDPNRLIAAKEIAADFIDNRNSDRIGLNVFARQSFTICPPTTDHRLLKELLTDIDIGMVQDGTAIGLGLATAINRLKGSEAESKVIILLTDGLNNAGEIDPVTAGELAEAHGIRVYTMGIGSRGSAPYPIQDPVFGTRYQNVSVDIDEAMLTRIADLTGGQFFRATHTEELQEVYMEIDELERSEVEEIIYTDYEDLYPSFLMPAILLGFLALLSDKVFFRTPLG
ncbi:MAG: VWA domain-containing protein [Balneolaceae bacterium]